MYKFVIKLIHHIKWRIGYTKMRTYLFFKIGIYEWLISPFLKRELATGIFKGMKYKNVSVGSVLLPKLYGTYESELQKLIQELDLNSFDVFIDIGCADGYYLAGIGKISTIGNIIGYDPNKFARKQCFKIISDNNLEKERFEVRGFFEEKDFSSLISNYKNCLFLIDVDGYEKELFKTVSISMLKNSSFLIETHEYIVPDILDSLYHYFEKTHSIKKIPSSNGHKNIKYINRFTYFVKKKIALEHRPGPQSFLKIIPKGHS